MARFALSVAVLAVSAVWVGPALGHFDATDRYTHRSCPATPSTRADPVNVVFTGWGTWGRAASQLETHAGWSSTTGSSQSFVDHGGCAPMHAQRASGLAARFHVRIRGQHEDAALGWVATAGAHHEDLVLFPRPCGHAVDSNGSGGSGFDQGRNELERAFASAGHVTSRVWWGNTRSFKQCDGDYAASDGWTVVVALHQVNH
jgi:hypothetical protein